MKRRHHNVLSITKVIPRMILMSASLSITMLMLAAGTYIVHCAPVNPLHNPRELIHPGYIAAQRALNRNELLPGAARGWLVHYETTGENHNIVWSDGLIFEPDVPAPSGGYKVVSYSHGAKGIPGRCQPSASRSYLSDPEYRLISALLKAGYATTMTDYPVTNGGTPFLGAYSEATSSLDIIRSAHILDPLLSNDIVIGGYSLGGQAALAASAIQREYAPEFVNHGTFTLAAPWGQDMIVDGMGPAMGANQLGLSAVIGLFLAGFLSSKPQYLPLEATYLTPHGIEIVHAASTNCLSDFWIVGAALTRPATLFKQPIGAGSSLAKVIEEYMRTPLSGITGPVLITQGSNDAFVQPIMAEAIETGLIDDGNNQVTRKMFPNTDHGNLPEHATPDILAFVKSVLG